MDLGDLADFVEPETLTFKVNSTSYVVSRVNAETWLRLHVMQASLESGATAGERITIAALLEMALGDQFEKIKTAESGAVLKRAGLAAYYWQLDQEALARATWEAGGKAPAPRRPARGTATQRPTRRAAASSTTADGTGTSARTKRKP